MAPAAARRVESAVFARRLARNLREIVQDMSNGILTQREDSPDRAMRAYSLGFAAAVIRKQADELDEVAQDIEDAAITETISTARPN